MNNLQPMWHDVKKWLDDISTNDPSFFAEGEFLADEFFCFLRYFCKLIAFFIIKSS